MKSKLLFLRSTFRVTKQELIEGILTAFLFSAFIYLAWIDIHFKALNTLLALLAFYRLIKASQGALLVSGFFIGLFWFYWVGFSFRYYDLTAMAPLVTLFFATGYMLIFWVIGFTKAYWQRSILLFLLTFVEPFAFNWLKPELLLVDSYIGVQLWQYGVVLASLTLFATLKKPFAYVALLLLISTVDYTHLENTPFPHSVSIIQSDIAQDKKWKPENKTMYIKKNFTYIKTAIENNKSLVIIPESNLPMYLNLYPTLMNYLKEQSYRIDIIIGSLYLKDKKNYNATYHFANGNVEIATKMILVPFGEYLPLPSFISNWLKDVVFDGADDYTTASKPTDFTIQGTKVRNAICYEATCEFFYEDHPKFIVATSNNAWFIPSIEPTLQKLLIKLYAKRYNVTVLHSINGSKSGIIYPKGNR